MHAVHLQKITLSVALGKHILQAISFLCTPSSAELVKVDNNNNNSYLPLSRMVTEIVGCILFVDNTTFILTIVLVAAETDLLVDSLVELLGSTDTDISLTTWLIVLEGDSNSILVDIVTLPDICIITDKSGRLVEFDLS